MMANFISASIGFAIGATLALAVLRTIEVAVKVIFTPGGKSDKKIKMAVFNYAKYIVIGFLIAIVVRHDWISLPAFACGVGVPSAIIFLKTLGQYFHEIEIFSVRSI
jgi:hypothetical protein